MCEYCSKTETTVEQLATDEIFPCEWISEEFGPGACAEQAVYAVSDWFVEDHLCEAHKLATEKEMEEGLGDFLDSVRFRSEFEIKPIEQEESCDYIAPTATDWKPCGKKASYAKYILDILCFALSMQPRQTATLRRHNSGKKTPGSAYDRGYRHANQ